MTKLFYFSIFFFCFFNGWASDFHRVITWATTAEKTTDQAKSSPSFEGCIRVDNTGLPYWFESFELSSSNAEVLVSNTVFESAENMYIDSNAISNAELKYTSEIVSSAGKTFLKLRIFPFISQNHRIEKLVGFTV